MINPKYYQDIKKFPQQFISGAELAKDIKVEGSFNRVVVCGMGGSALYVDLINDFLKAKGEQLRIEACRDYSIPNNGDEKTLFVISSYSGNTEETLSCLKEVEERNFSHCIFCAGGELLDKAKEKNVPFYLIPSGIQPRLSTGYYIVGILQLLKNCGLINDKIDEVLVNANNLEQNLNEEKAKELAKKLMNNVPIVYGTDVISSLARISKIKFNENSKIQAFWNNFPELNHNEMVGFTNIIMKPFFLILQSKFCDPRNKKRIETFTKLMQEKDLPVEIILLSGENVLAEILNAYYFIDHVTYYLAQEQNINPEPVAMVEEFKKMISQ